MSLGFGEEVEQILLKVSQGQMRVVLCCTLLACYSVTFSSSCTRSTKVKFVQPYIGYLTNFYHTTIWNGDWKYR